MERKVRTIRLWLLTAIVAAVGCWEPALWFGVPLFFFPTCACCGFPACAHCSVSHSGPIQIVVSGVTSTAVACQNCANLNGTYELPQFNSCIWQLDLPSDIAITNCNLPTSNPANINRIQFTISTINVDGFFSRNSGGATTVCAWRESLATFSNNCDGWSSESCNDNGVLDGSMCNGSAATYLITAL